MLTGTLALVLATLGMSPAISQRSAAGASSVGPPSGAAPAIVVPPKLHELEQRGLQLAVTSVRFSLRETIVGLGPPGGPFGRLLARTADSLPLIEVTGEQNLMPQQASFRVSVFGLTIEGRLIGTTLYIDEPFIAQADGGRPWVIVPHQSLQQAVGVEAAPLGGNGQSGATEAYGKLFETVDEATSIRELGPMTINGQPTTAFGASVELRTIVGEPKARGMLKVFEPLVRIEICLAEDGLPVRSRVTLVVRPHRHEPRSEVIAESDILAINVPVTVKPPPAGKTITLARLHRLLMQPPKRKRRPAEREDRS